jgi:SAM-dependent methyltransferase
MSSSHVLKLKLHQIAYLLSYFLPLRFFWSKLHSRDYHPNLEGIKTRISQSKLNPQDSLFVRWSDQLNYSLNLENKSVLEIGHGGAWYLAAALDAGAREVVGYEISKDLNERASTALRDLAYSDFQLFEGNGKDLGILKGRKFDVIYSITVLQHLPTRTTKRYLRDIANLLESNGVCVIQTLHSYGRSRKRLSIADLFSMAYSKSEFESIIYESGLEILSYSQEEYGSQETFWGIYLLNKGSF